MSISVKDLTVKYQNSVILDKITFELSAGDYLGIVGPNGSGKTTLVKAILGLVPSVQGRIEILGELKSSFKNWRRIGYLPQKTYISRQGFPATVTEIVASGLLAKKPFPKRISKTDRQAVIKVLALLQIEELEHKMIGQLSGGQIQRVLLARALICEPQILILDEPTVALDPATREQFYQILYQLNREKKTTILLITHDSHTIGEYATKLLYLDRRIIYYGDFKSFCESEAMTEYFGEFAQHQICHQHQRNHQS